ncbi:MAG: ATP-binding cassette domain-containing protein [Bacillota bacterium]
MKNSNSLEIKNLSSKINGQQVLDNFNLKVKKGSIHSVLFKNEQSKNELLKFLTAKKEFGPAELIIEGANISREKLQNLNQNKIYLIDQYSAVNPEKDPLGVFQFNKKGNVAKKSTVFPEMTIAENIFFGREPLKSFLFFKSIDNQKMVEQTEELLSLLTIDLSPGQKMVELSPLEKQLVAVLKAISCQVEILLIDQAVLKVAAEKKKIFFNFLKTLKAKGITIVYFTQEIKEVFASSSYVSVLKNGQSTAEYKVSQLEYNELALLLMGE